MRQALAITSALALAAPAGAEDVYMPECGDPDIGLYDVAWHQGGFVFYGAGRHDAGETLLVIEDCPRQRRLTMQVFDKGNTSKGAALFDTVDAAVRSKRRYTMGQIQAIAREAGAKTKLGQATSVSCACFKYGAVAP